MEMRCYCNILCISYKDQVTNEVVRAKIQQAIGPHGELLTIVKRYKLKWYGHVSRSSDLIKTILHGTVKGGIKGRQRKMWEDNIREWTGRVEISKEEIPGSKRSMYGYILTYSCLLYTSPSPRDSAISRMPSSA